MQDDDKLYPVSQRLSVGKANKTNKCRTLTITRSDIGRTSRDSFVTFCGTYRFRMS
jgi:hypothetical protein